MRPLIFLVVAVLLFAGFASALEVHVYDSELFEIDTFALGDGVVVRAVSDAAPLINISEQNIYKEKMVFVNESLYEFRLTPQRQGTYNIEVFDGQDSVDIQFFVASGLDIDWDQVEEEFSEKEVVDTDTSMPNQSVKVEINMGGSFFSRFWAWLRQEVGDR